MARTKPKSKPRPLAKRRLLPIKRSVLRVLILSFISGGLYLLYWLYATRTLLNEELGAKASLPNVSPMTQTLGPPALLVASFPLMLVLVGFLVLPAALVLGVIVWYYLVRDLNQVRASAKLETTEPWLYVGGYIVLSFMSPANLAVPGVLAYQLNETWDKLSNGKAKEAPYTAAEIVVSLAGIILFTLLFILGIVAAIIGAVANQ